MKEHDHVVFGSLLHDIGKFFERADILGEYCKNADEMQRYCKKNQDGRLGYFHVLRTLSFCEKLFETVTILKPVEQQHQRNADQHWVNLASYHHNPSPNQDNYLEKLVQAADHFASAEREEGSYYEKSIHKKTRLESLLSRVTINGVIRESGYFMPLKPIDLDSVAIYPKKAEQWGMTQTNNDKGKVWLGNQEELVSDYENMAIAFINDINKLPKFRKESPEALRSTIRTLLALMETYLSQVPAATNVLRPDISLYDHLRITAAIAEGLYIYHFDTGNLSNAKFKDMEVTKWCLICGDFSGIQKFIYKITGKGAAKSLRGRSFFIQLLCDAVSEQLIRKLQLYSTARIYSSGGKFYLLIPSTKIDVLTKEVNLINNQLLKQFQGDVFLGIGIAKVKGDDFKEGNMGKRWKEANEDLMKNRLKPFNSNVTEDIACFTPEALHSEGACQVCSRDDKQAGIVNETNDEGLNNRICKQCKDLREVGRVLADTRYLFWAWGVDRDTIKHKKISSLYRLDLCGTDCTLYFLNKSPEFSEISHLENCHLESINRIETPNGNPQGYSTGFRFVGKWQKNKQDSDWEFDDFAENATNIKRLGILRMDVDNLGEIFIRGLHFKQLKGQPETMGSLSRVATLSRQLQLFFAGYLPNILKQFSRSQIIYAGGDDVFIIGSWDELPDVAKKIRDQFRSYCADNENFTLSGGIAIVGGKYPISRAAVLAGEAETQAKQLERNGKHKDALYFLETAIGWESFDKSVKMKNDIISITKKTNSHAIIDRLRQVVIATEGFKKINRSPNSKQEINEMIYWDKWRWRLIYNLKRMSESNPVIKHDLETLQQQLIEPIANNDQPVLDWLQMPVRWAEYLMRSKNND